MDLKKALNFFWKASNKSTSFTLFKTIKNVVRTVYNDWDMEVSSSVCLCMYWKPSSGPSVSSEMSGFGMLYFGGIYWHAYVQICQKSSSRTVFFGQNSTKAIISNFFVCYWMTIDRVSIKQVFFEIYVGLFKKNQAKNCDRCLIGFYWWI